MLQQAKTDGNMRGPPSRVDGQLRMQCISKSPDGIDTLALLGRGISLTRVMLPR